MGGNLAESDEDQTGECLFLQAQQSTCLLKKRKKHKREPKAGKCFSSWSDISICRSGSSDDKSPFRVGRVPVPVPTGTCLSFFSPKDKKRPEHMLPVFDVHFATLKLGR